LAGEGKMNIDDLLGNITWLGHDSFRIAAGGKVIYFDPYQLKSNVPADIVFITHGHFDHCSMDDINAIVRASTVMVSDAGCAPKLKGNVKVVKPGDKLKVDGMDVEAVPAYNLNKKFHPKAEKMVGYIIDFGGTRLYLAGDTDFIPEMKKIKADVAILPVGGTYTMTADEAVQAALAIAPQVAIPMHYGSVVGTPDDAKRFQEALQGKIKVVILKQGK
jgi:L-ascorbate metabolism protein UlaG (beta-lactamase superfamily)